MSEWYDVRFYTILDSLYCIMMVTFTCGIIVDTQIACVQKQNHTDPLPEVMDLIIFR